MLRSLSLATVLAFIPFHDCGYDESPEVGETTVDVPGEGSSTSGGSPGGSTGSSDGGSADGNACLATSCDDGNPCTSDVCSADGGCVHAPVAGTCSIGGRSGCCLLGQCCVRGCAACKNA